MVVRWACAERAGRALGVRWVVEVHQGAVCVVLGPSAVDCLKRK